MEEAEQAWPSEVNSQSRSQVTLVRRFGSALNLNIHLPMLFLEGVLRAAPVIGVR